MIETPMKMADLCYLPHSYTWQDIRLPELQRTFHQITGIRLDAIKLDPQP